MPVKKSTGRPIRVKPSKRTIKVKRFGCTVQKTINVNGHSSHTKRK